MHAVLQLIFKDLVKLFAQLPLAALVESNTLILHGGLFRLPPPKYTKLPELPKRVLSQLQTGSLDDLRNYKVKRKVTQGSGKGKRQVEVEEWYKGGVDPEPLGESSAHNRLRTFTSLQH